MNNSELDSILKKARTPQSSEKFLREFPGQITQQLERERENSSFGFSARRISDESSPQREFQRWFPRFAFAVAAAICVLAAFAIGHWRGSVETEASSSKDILANTKFVRETLSMFPNRVRAIVRNDHGLNLVLSESADIPSSPPLYVRICDGNNCSSFVTFSGQQIEIAGRKMTVLSDARGGIILEGNQFVWSSTSRDYASDNLKIEARNLSVATM